MIQGAERARPTPSGSFGRNRSHGERRGPDPILEDAFERSLHRPASL
jgi:hypothetical protein